MAAPGADAASSGPAITAGAHLPPAGGAAAPAVGGGRWGRARTPLRCYELFSPRGGSGPGAAAPPVGRPLPACCAGRAVRRPGGTSGAGRMSTAGAGGSSSADSSSASSGSGRGAGAGH